MVRQAVREALAIAVAKRAYRIETTDVTKTGEQRVGAAGRYAIFEVRARILTRVGDTATRRVARLALKRLGTDPSPSALRQALHSPEPQARLAAAIGLGIRSDALSQPVLLKLSTSDPEVGVREMAKWALGVSHSKKGRAA